MRRKIKGDMIMLRDLVIKNRSYRRFKQDIAVGRDTLKQLVDLARVTASPHNMQPLKYILSCDAETNEKIFSTLSWAKYIEDWAGPAPGERPPAYIIILGDTEISHGFERDAGIAAQTIMLGAVEMGYGGCIMGSAHQEKLRNFLKIDKRYQIMLVLPIGKPAEKSIIEETGPDGDIKYWRDSNDVHHVPKRALDDIILE
jgi:nitroreductase